LGCKQIIISILLHFFLNFFESFLFLSIRVLTKYYSTETGRQANFSGTAVQNGPRTYPPDHHGRQGPHTPTKRPQNNPRNPSPPQLEHERRYRHRRLQCQRLAHIAPTQHSASVPQRSSGASARFLGGPAQRKAFSSFYGPIYLSFFSVLNSAGRAMARFCFNEAPPLIAG
jgi:hypothetical protein